MKIAFALTLASLTLVAPGALLKAETQENTSDSLIVVDHTTGDQTSEPDLETLVRNEPQKVYVESSDGTYRATRNDDHCFYNEEHDHIHCYADDPSLSKTVFIEEQTTYRSTRNRSRDRVIYRDRHDPIATGLGVGLAIGLPILIHNNLHHQRHYRYNRHYNSRYNSHRNSHRNSHYKSNRRHDNGGNRGGSHDGRRRKY